MGFRPLVQLVQLCVGVDHRSGCSGNTVMSRMSLPISELPIAVSGLPVLQSLMQCINVGVDWVSHSVSGRSRSGQRLVFRVASGVSMLTQLIRVLDRLLGLVMETGGQVVQLEMLGR